MTNDPFDAQEARVWESGAAVGQTLSRGAPHGSAAERLAERRRRNSRRRATTLTRASAARRRARCAAFSTSGSRGCSRSTWRSRCPTISTSRRGRARPRHPRGRAAHRARARAALRRDGRRPPRRESGARVAGDGLGRADVAAVERMCADNPDVRFLATFLSRENQHELCVAARKFRNLMPFGCWWFLNNPSIISEITTRTPGTARARASSRSTRTRASSNN